MKFFIFCIIFFIFFYSYTFAEGLSGWINLYYNNIKQFENDEEISTSTNFSRNLYLTLEKPITPVLSSRLYFRTNWTDFKFSEAENKTTETYQRAAELALDAFLRNPIYNINAGYRRLEQWSTANLSDKSRITTESYYSYINITPYNLPPLSLQFDRQKNFDHLPVKQIDTTTDKYYLTSQYRFTFKDFKLSYNIAYSHNINKTPLNVISKSINDNLNTSYNFDFNRFFWNRKINVYMSYQGNYWWNKDKQFSRQTTTQSFKRTPIKGIYVKDDTPERTDITEQMQSLSALTDEDYSTAIDTINLSNDKYHNIGIDTRLLFSKSIDEIRVYVNQSLDNEFVLNNPSNWGVYYTNNDPTNSGSIFPVNWTSVSILSVNKKQDIYGRWYFEIKIPSTIAYFIKVVNKEKSNLADLKVTEIEAYGIDTIQQGWTTEKMTFFTQRLGFNLNFTPTEKLIIATNYSIDRMDQNPDSISDSVGGIFKNITSNSLPDEEKDLKSNLIRNYGITSTWFAHRLLTTILRFQRSESLDNKNETNFSSNTYSLSFSSLPLPTLDMNLSLIKNESYSFDEKQSVNNLIFLSIGAKLYKDLNTITEIGYTKTKTYSPSSESSTSYFRERIDAYFTQKLFGSFTFDYSKVSDTTSYTSKNGVIMLTYRPGRFINLTSNFRISQTETGTSSSEGISLDWLFVPTVRLNLSYEHRNEPESTTIDNVNGYVMWRITKFMDMQFTFYYSRNVKEEKSETLGITANLTCRF